MKEVLRSQINVMDRHVALAKLNSIMFFMLTVLSYLSILTLKYAHIIRCKFDRDIMIK